MPDVSVLLVNYKTPHLAVEALRSLLKHNPALNLELIVVDNDSGDDSETLLKREFPGLIWHQMGYNSGFGRANNAAMQRATGRYFLLLNADTLQTGNALEECVRRLDAEPELVAGAPEQVYADGTPIPNYKSFAEIRRSFFILPSHPVAHKLLNFLVPQTHYADSRQADWLTGAFVLVRREAALQTGGFDERFFMYAEDVEWSHRLGKIGKLCYFGDLTFFHLENQTELRRQQPTYVNRFAVQTQVSNLLWVRIQYGIGAYLAIIVNYLALIPAFMGWKMLLNSLKGRPLTSQLVNQRLFARKVAALLHYFTPTLFNRNHFFKVAPKDQIS